MRALAALLLLATLTACAEPVLEDDACGGGKCDEAQAVPNIHVPELLVNDLAVLGALEAEGYDLGTQLGGDSGNNRVFGTSSPAYSLLREVVIDDISEIAANDSLAGTEINRFHRLFNVDWLSSSAARFRLVAISNRPDLDFDDPEACGEVRFVYRLMYESPAGPSRLPMNLMVVRKQPATAGGCAEVAQAWRSYGGNLETLRSEILPRLDEPSSVELNLQAVRWPAGARPNMGGHAEYLLRVFEIQGDELGIATLPNTVSTDLTEAEADALESWVRDNLEAIDQGTARVPQEFLATRAYSVSPRGLARTANRPFYATLGDAEQRFGDIDFGDKTLIKSPEGLMRRLDTMSCQGCHQSRGLAGFHILGLDDLDLPRGNAIEVGSSPHLNDELSYRQDYLEDIAEGFSPNSHRPFAERVANIPGTYGAHCGLGDPSYTSWSCADGFECVDLNGEEVGTCMPVEGSGAGDACIFSALTDNADGHKDKIIDVSQVACTLPSGAAGSCSTTEQGFPNGSCTGRCSEMGATTGDRICGATPPSGFNNCLQEDRPFSECLENSRPAMRRRCDAFTPCGDDYVCSGVQGAPQGVGACMPPYFIFQARVDGHRVPE